MNETDLIRRVGLGVAAVGLPVLASIAVGLPLPIALLLIALAVVAVVVTEWLRRRPEPVVRPAPTPPPPPPPPPPPRATRPIRGSLPSDTPGYCFHLSGTMTWESLAGPRGPWHAEPAVFGEKVLLDRAAEVTRTCSPTNADGARRRVAELLGTQHGDEDGRVRVWATDISLDVDEKDAERLREVAGLQKDELLWERRRAHERNVRTYLGEDALATTGSSVVWWLANHLDDVEQAVSLVEDLHRLSRVARGDLDDRPAEHFLLDRTSRLGDDRNGMDAPGPDTRPSAPRPTAVDLVDELFPQDSDERRYFVHEFGQLLHGAGRPDREQELRDTFGVPRADVPPAEEPPEPWADPDDPGDPDDRTSGAAP